MDAPDPRSDLPDPRSDLAALRTEYELGGLDEADAGDDPMALFTRWFDQARAGGVHEPNAMVLATVAADGRPSSRTVLLKGVDDRGFSFFTNHTSRKARELAHQPRCALLFGWYDVQRQVRVEGIASLLPREETEAYFASRPRGSQIGAWASAQSSVVADRDELDRIYTETEQRFPDEVPCPPGWGGYLVEPTDIEFWQGRRSRMHDRIAFNRLPEGWRKVRLAP